MSCDEKQLCGYQTMRQVCQEVADLLDLEVQSTDEYWCDIDGMRIKYTRKEYERQILFQKPKIPKTIKKKKISKRQTNSMIDRLFGSKAKVYVQSADVNTHGGESVHIKAENVDFIDESRGDVMSVPSGQDDSMLDDMMPSVELSEYLSRPVLIKSLTYAQATTVGVKTSFYPWKDYFNSTPIKKKLDNFAFINCKLHLKVVINTSPFYYGSYMLNYTPLWAQANGINTDSSLGELIPQSQRPHIWIYPQTNQGGEMILPFFYPKNWLDCTSSNDLIDMGAITPIVYAPLLSSNGASGASTTIQVYAWAEDVKLMGPTIKLAVQSADEYSAGPVEKLASAMASASGYLENVPIIGRYMRASSIIATAVGSVAHLFGFTNVPNIANVHAFKNQPFPHFASTEISTPVEKLTLDPKNELCIDPRTVGLDGTDELSIKYICSKESFLGTGIIALSDVVDYQPFAAFVSNMYSQHVTGANPYRFLPLSYVSSAFQYWRGDIIFRFKFICTKYHKGRVRITYDPLGNISTNADSYSTAFNRVVDIGEENDVEVIVPYMQARSWLLVEPSPSATAWIAFNGGTLAAPTIGTHNGMISIRLVTPLSAPTTTADVRVQVFVRAGDNFEVAMPRANLGFTTQALQSQDEWDIDAFDQDIQSEDIIDYGEPTKVIAGTSYNNAHPARHLVNMGETICSLRQLMRRSTFVISVGVPNATATDGTAAYSHIFSKYPPFYGYDTTSYVQAPGTVVPGSNFGFNYVGVTPYGWFSPMYIGQRGSMIWHINTRSKIPLGNTRVSKYSGTLTGATANKTTIDFGQPATFGKVSYSNMRSKADDWGGSSVTNQNTQTGLSALLPQYNPNRFTFVNPTYANQGQSVDNTNYELFRLQYDVQPIAHPAESFDNVTIDKYVSIGPDFTLFFWLNVPDTFFIGFPVIA